MKATKPLLKFKVHSQEKLAAEGFSIVSVCLTPCLQRGSVIVPIRWCGESVQVSAAFGHYGLYRDGIKMTMAQTDVHILGEFIDDMTAARPVADQPKLRMCSCSSRDLFISGCKCGGI